MSTRYYQRMVRDKFIAVVDFGSQYSHLIMRSLRELGAEAELVRPNVSVTKLKKAAGLILSGSPASVIKNPIAFNSKILGGRVPILGICYGLQLIMHERGGRITPGSLREYGPAKLRLARPHTLLNGLPPTSMVWMSHGDSVTKLPPGFQTIGSTATLKHAAVAHQTKPIFGLQFHPEVHHTDYGQQLYKNFVYNICHITPQTPGARLEKIINDVQAQVGNKNVFLLVSGGVDSTVAFALLNRALGTGRVCGLHIDTGLMRQQEADLVRHALRKAGFKNLHVVRAGKTFLKALKNISQPEHKRQVIGLTFLAVKNLAERKLKLNVRQWMLGQGTIYPDTIESGGTKHADKIKTHHNRIGVLTKLAAQGKLIEPLKELYKDEVRQLGIELGLPKELLWQHPFPGPGLAVRVLCVDEKTSRNLNNLKSRIPLRTHNTRVMPVLSVGVQGDERSYRHPLAIEAKYADAQKIHRLSAALVNKHLPINRVIIKLLGKPLSSGKTHASYLTPGRIKLARRADNIVHQQLKKAGVYNKLWQCPVVLAPFGAPKGESIILRPFLSREAMTGRAAMLPAALVGRLARSLARLNGVDYVFYDLTDKPPGTVEWE